MYKVIYEYYPPQEVLKGEVFQTQFHAGDITKASKMANNLHESAQDRGFQCGKDYQVHLLESDQ